MSSQSSILVVDDTDEFRNVVVGVLKASGFHVTDVASAPEALNLLKSESFNLVLSDFQMPAMSGIELFREMRNGGISIPFILMSGNHHLAEQEAAGLEICAVLQKPFDSKTLKTLIASILSTEAPQIKSVS